MAGFTVNAENAERFPETCVFISFQDAYDSSATHMWAANYAKDGYPLKGLQQYSAFGG